MNAPGTTGLKRQRSCIVCGAKNDKVSFYRFVRDGDGNVHFDPTGRKPGRGAYVCSAACLEKAASAGKLERALRTKMDREEYRRLADELIRTMGLDAGDEE